MSIPFLKAYGSVYNRMDLFYKRRLWLNRRLIFILGEGAYLNASMCLRNDGRFLVF